MKANPLYDYNSHIVNEMETKHITIREDQANWIRENSLNLSRFVQKKLDELMEKDAKTDV